MGFEFIPDLRRPLAGDKVILTLRGNTMVLADWLQACRSENLQTPTSGKRRRPKTKNRTVALECLEQRVVLAETPLNELKPHGVWTVEPGVNPNAAAASTEEAHAEEARYNPNFSWTSTATNAGPLAIGQPRTLTWSVVPDGTTTDDSVVSGLVNFFNTAIGGSGPTIADKPWFPIFDLSFERLESLSGLTFTFEPNDDGAALRTNNPGVLGVRGDMRISGKSIDGQSGSNVLAYNYFPSYGDMVIDTDNITFYSQTGNNFLTTRNVLAHEFGHGVALDHVESNNAEFLMEPFINLNFDGPQLDDIVGLHRGYGDALEKLGGDTFGAAVPFGVLSGATPIEIGTLGDSTVVTPTQKDFVSIDDESDPDYFSFTLNTPVEVSINLNPKGASYLEGPQGGAQNTLNLKSQGNLGLQLFDSVGNLITASDVTGVGGSESILNRTLSTGTYVVKVASLTPNVVQLYNLKLTGVDLTPPVADIVDIAPDPRGAVVGTVSVVFDEDVTGVDASDFELTRNGLPQSLVGMPFTAVSGTQYEVDLSSFTNQSGNYTLRLKSAGSGIANVSSLSLATDAFDSWVTDLDPPIGDLVDVSPDPRTGPVNSVSLTFNEPVTGVGISDFRLTRNGINLSLIGKSVIAVSPTEYVVNITGLSAVEGNYTLTLESQGSGIVDSLGNALASDVLESWSVDFTGPVPDIIDVSPDPRNSTAGLVTVSFNEGVSGVGADDFALTRSGTLLNISGVAVTQISPSQYALDLTAQTSVDGNYELLLNNSGTGIVDLAGNPMVVGAGDTWIKEAVRPTASITPVVPALRNIPVPKIEVNFSEAVTGVSAGSFTLLRNGVAVALTNGLVVPVSTSQYTVDVSALTGVDGDYEFYVTGTGVSDQAGNLLQGPVVESFEIDATAPTSPTLATPISNSFINDMTPAFVWGASTDANAVTYSLTVASDSGFSSVVDSTTGVSGTTFTFANPLLDGAYFWKVEATDAAGNTKSSAISSFKVDTVAPDSFSLQSPLDQSFVDTLLPTFIWDDTSDDRTSVTYKLEVSTVSDFSSVVLSKSGLTSATYTLQTGEELADEVRHYWRITATDMAGNATVSNVFEFTPDLTPPRIQVAFDGTSLTVRNLDFGSTGRLLRITQSGAALTFFTPNAIDEIDADGLATQVDKHTVSATISPTGNSSVAVDLDGIGDQIVIDTNLSLVSSSLGITAESIRINAANSILATRDLEFVGATIIDTTSLTVSGGANVVFDGPVNSASGELNELRVNTAFGVTFTSTIGANDRFSKLSTSPVGSTTIGGDVFLNGSGDSIFGDNVELAADVNVDQDGTGAVIFNAAVDSVAGESNTLTVDTTGGATQLNGAIGTVDGLGRTTTVDNLVMGSSSLLALDLDGAIAGTSYDTVVVNGSVTLGNASLDLDFGFSPAVNSSFKIIDNDGSGDAVNGTFSGLAESAAFNQNGYLLTISYIGGDGNDIVVTVTGQVKVKFTSSSATVGEESSSAQAVTVELESSGVTLTEAVSIDVTAALSSSASVTADYTGGGQITFPVGSTDGATASVSFSTVNDALIEGDEVIALELVNAFDVFADATAASHNLTIDDNDTATITIVGTTTLTEEGGAQGIVVTLATSDGVGGTATLAPGVAVTAEVVDATGGTATSGSDYTAINSLSFSFDNGAGNGATKSVNLAVLNDSLIEGNESINVGLGGLVSSFNGQVTLSSSSGVVTIDDNDTVSLAIAKSATLTEEGGSQTVAVTLTTNDGSGGAATLATGVSISADIVDGSFGNSVSGLDYSAIGTQTVTFSAGASNGATQTIAIDVSNDPLVEGNETLSLTLQNISSSLDGQATLGNSSVSVTIDDNDTARLDIATTASSAEEGGAISVAVTLVTSDGAGGAATLAPGITLAADIVDALTGDAVSGADYTGFGTQAVVFTAGATNGATQNVTFTPTNDTLIEGDEAVGLKLQNLNSTLNSQASLGDTASVVTIIDNDTATVSIATTGSIGEAGELVGITITLTTSDGAGGAATLADGIEVSALIQNAGTGTAGVLDIAPFADQSILFSNGAGSGSQKTVFVSIKEDSLLEGNETIVLEIDSLADTLDGQVSIGSATSTITIVDNDIAEIAIVNDPFVIEGQQAVFEVTLKALNQSGGLANLAPGVSINANVVGLTTGTATVEDYASIGSTTVTFNPGEGFGARRLVTFATTNDNLIEGRESVDFALQSPGPILNGQVTLGDGGTVTITDNDTAVLRFVPLSGSVDEIAGSQAITVTLDTDDGAGGSAILGPGVSITALVTELAGGTATKGSDFDFTAQTVTFGSLDADGATRTATLSIRGDSLIEGDEFARFRLQDLNTTLNGLVSLDATPLAIEINDNDTATISIALSTIAPETNGNKTVIVTLHTLNEEGGTATVAPGVAFSASVGDLGTGTATRQNDFSMLTSAPVMFGINDGDGSQRQVSVYVGGDSLVEGNETVNLRLRDLNNTVGGQVSLGNTDGTLIIDDNDTAQVQIVPVSILENGGAQNVQVRLVTSNGEGGAATLATGVSVSATVSDLLNGTATSGTDYSAFEAKSVTFAAGSTNGAAKTVSVTPLNDTTAEPAETIRLGLGGLNSTFDGQVSVGPAANVTIRDDEVATIEVRNAEILEGNAGTKTLTFEVVLTGTVQNAVSFDFETADNTATAGSDYVALTKTTRTFASSTSGAVERIAVTINGDTVGEPTEFFDLRLSNVRASGAPIQFAGGATTINGTGRIINDDVALMVKLLDGGVLSIVDPAGATGVDSNVRVLLRPETNEYLVRAASAVLSDADGNTVSEVKFAVSKVTSINADLGAGNDTLTLIGIPLPSTVNAGPGNDVVFGGTLADVLTGADGNDSLYGNEGNDTILGGAGVDLITGDSGNDLLRGQGATDYIEGGLGIDVIDGGAGELYAKDDLEGFVEITNTGYSTTRGDRVSIDAGTGNFLRALELRGGDGADTFSAATFTDGNVTLIGNGGNDTLYGGAFNDVILGGAGNDILQGRAGRDYLQGGLGDDIARGQGGVDTIGGGLGNDRLDGSTGENLLQEEVNANMVLSTVVGTTTVTTLTGIGTDILEGDFTSAILIGGASNNVLDARGFAGAVTLIGGAGNDVLFGANLRTVADGGDGDDTIVGGAGADLLSGGSGNDSISGGAGADKILGGSGNDTLSGGAGIDQIVGEEGDDSINGDAGLDKLAGGGNGIARSTGDVITSESPDEVIDSLFVPSLQGLLSAILRLA